MFGPERCVQSQREGSESLKWKAERGRVNDDNSIMSVKLPDVLNRMIGIESRGGIEFQGCYTRLDSSCLSQLPFSFDCYVVVEYM